MGGALHHFTVEAAAGGAVASQQAGVPFTVKITARDASNNTVTGFDGTVDVGSNSQIAGGPFTTGSFVAGVRSQTISLTQGGLLTTITATQTGAGVSGTSNAFTVFAADGSGSLTTPTGSCVTARLRTRLSSRTRRPRGGSRMALSLEVPEGWSPPSTSARSRVGADKHGRPVGLRPDDHCHRFDPQRGPDGRDYLRVEGGYESGATAPTASGPQSWVVKSRGVAGGSFVQLASSPQITVLAPDGSGRSMLPRPLSTRAAAPTRSSSPTPLQARW